MPSIRTDDGVELYYEEAGSGTPIVFVHEFAGDCRSFEPQMRYFSRDHRCIAYNARGYPPSSIPDDPALDASLFLKRTVPCAGLVVFPRTGHALNIEEPALYNQHLADLFRLVESGHWTLRDPRSRSDSTLRASR